LKNLEIPIPESDEKIQEWTEKISKPYNDYIDKTKEYQQLESQIQIDIQKMIDTNPCNKVKLGDICELQDGYDFYRKEMDDRKYYIHNENLPLLKINSNNITDYVKINEKYNKYTVYLNDLVIGTKGSCGHIRKCNIKKGYHKHGLLKFKSIKINKDYLFYFIKNYITDDFIEKNTKINY
jgi:hypothetical protein